MVLRDGVLPLPLCNVYDSASNIMGGEGMIANFYKTVIRIAAVICAYSIIVNLFDLDLPLRGSMFMDTAFMLVWIFSEIQWKKEAKN